MFFQIKITYNFLIALNSFTILKSKEKILIVINNDSYY